MRHKVLALFPPLCGSAAGWQFPAIFFQVLMKYRVGGFPSWWSRLFLLILFLFYRFSSPQPSLLRPFRSLQGVFCILSGIPFTTRLTVRHGGVALFSLFFPTPWAGLFG